MKLELKHLAPYLPYKMKSVIDMYEFTEGNCKPEIRHFTMGNDLSMCLNYGKPILRPLSDLFNGNYEDILDEFSERSLESFKIAFLSELKPLNAFDKINYTIAVKLFENHFDVFGLIEQGLAIDKNTIL